MRYWAATDPALRRHQRKSLLRWYGYAVVITVALGLVLPNRSLLGSAIAGLIVLEIATIAWSAGDWFDDFKMDWQAVMRGTIGNLAVVGLGCAIGVLT